MSGRLPHDWFPGELPDNVTIGEGAWLYSTYAFRHYLSQRPAGVRIGAHSGVYHNTYFDLGPEGEVEIGRFCAIVGVVICTNQRVEVHDFAFVAHEVVIADAAAAVPGPRSTAQGRGVVLGENSWVGTRAVLLSGARIGRDVIVGAGAVVDFTVPDGRVVAGNPARVIGRG